MFYNVDDFPELAIISNSIDTLRSEYFQFIFSSSFSEFGGIIDGHSNWWVRDNGFHKEQIGYDIRGGGYTSLAIFKKNFPVKYMNVEKLFPRTISLVRGLIDAGIDIFYVSFPIIQPGAVLGLHSHNRKHLVYHLLLNDLGEGGCEIECAGEKRILRDSGDELVFDYSLPHGSRNLSDNPRINLLIDFLPSHF